MSFFTSFQKIVTDGASSLQESAKKLVNNVVESNNEVVEDSEHSEAGGSEANNGDPTLVKRKSSLKLHLPLSSKAQQQGK